MEEVKTIDEQAADCWDYLCCGGNWSSFLDGFRAASGQLETMEAQIRDLRQGEIVGDKSYAFLLRDNELQDAEMSELKLTIKRLEAENELHRFNLMSAKRHHVGFDMWFTQACYGEEHRDLLKNCWWQSRRDAYAKMEAMAKLLDEAECHVVAQSYRVSARQWLAQYRELKNG